MSTRKIKNAVNNTTGELIYFKGHAQATYMSDGGTVEDAIKNIKPDIDLSDYVKSEELEGYAKTSDIPSLEGYAKTEDIPSLDGYAKTSDIPSLDGYVQSSQLPDFNEFIKSDDIPSLEGLATEDFVTSQGYLTEIPSEYITNTELNSKGYATKTELNSLDFDNINNTPFTNDENGELNIVDEQGNIGMKLDGECLYVKDVVAGEHILSEKVDTNKIATINGKALTEGGNIEIGGKEYVKKEIVGIGSLDFHEDEPLEPNKVYYCTEQVKSIQVSNITPPTNDVAEYLVYFTTENINMEPSVFLISLLWANGDVPTIEGGVTYELSIVATKLGGNYIYKAVLTPFKQIL